MASAIATYAASLPEVEHHLLRNVRVADSSSLDSLRAFSDVRSMPPLSLAAVKRVRRDILDLKPEVVHLHSSWAGVLGRVATIGVRHKPRVVYTPHCFASERQDVGALRRQAYWLMERFLARRTDVIAGCSPREVWLAQRLRAREQPVLIPNVSGSLRTGTRRAQGGSRPPLVVAGGRFGPQKDPDLFAEIAGTITSRLVVEPTFIWVGGTRDSQPRWFRERGIEVTGWLPRAEALDQVRAADVYVHTAAWEGFPMAVLEAVEMGVPVVARDIPALLSCPPEWLFSSTAQAREQIERILTDDRARRQNVAQWSAALSENTVASQARALRSAYALAPRARAHD